MFVIFSFISCVIWASSLTSLNLFFSPVKYNCSLPWRVMVGIKRCYIQNIWHIVGVQRRKRQIWKAALSSPKSGAQHAPILQAHGWKRRESTALIFPTQPSPLLTLPRPLFSHLPASSLSSGTFIPSFSPLPACRLLPALIKGHSGSSQPRAPSLRVPSLSRTEGRWR